MSPDSSGRSTAVDIVPRDSYLFKGCSCSAELPRDLVAPRSFLLDQRLIDYAAIGFFFLRQPSRPNPTRLEAKSGNAVGKGTGEIVLVVPLACERLEHQACADFINCVLRKLLNFAATHRRCFLQFGTNRCVNNASIRRINAINSSYPRRGR